MAFSNLAWAERAPKARPQRPRARHLPQAGFPIFCGLIVEHAANGNVKAAGRLALKTLWSPGPTFEWVAALDSLCDHVGVAVIPFDLARKPTRSFLHQGFSARARINLLKTHYELLLTCLGSAVCKTLLSGAKIDILDIVGREGETYSVHLERSKINAREGELNVAFLRKKDNLCIASLGLVFGDTEGHGPAVLWIGGLQGCRSTSSKLATAAATKDLSGLRPKDLLMIAAYGLCDRLNITGIRAISNSAHVHAERGGKTWKADYDAFWIEQGASATLDGFFLLPRTRRRRNLEDVPAAKRKAWLKRQVHGQSVFDAVQRL